MHFTENGIKTEINEYEFDIIILATGFQAYTGALEAFDIIGQSGESIREKWETESKSIMGVCISDFPNLFTVFLVFRIDDVGLTAKDTIISCPLEIPPKIPPALFDLNFNFLPI